MEEKSKEVEAGKDATESGVTKEEIRAGPEKVADTGAAVKIEAGINIREIEAEAKKESLYFLRLFQTAELFT